MVSRTPRRLKLGWLSTPSTSTVRREVGSFIHFCDLLTDGERAVQEGTGKERTRLRTLQAVRTSDVMAVVLQDEVARDFRDVPPFIHQVVEASLQNIQHFLQEAHHQLALLAEAD